MDIPYVQRLRITFNKKGSARFIGHLDLARTWERALNRAKIPMAYTQGFNRRPRMQFASALPLGYMGDREIIDLWLKELIEPADALAQLNDKMAPGIRILSAESVPTSQASLPAMTTDAHYHVLLKYVEDVDAAELQTRIDNVLSQEEIIREKHAKKNRGKTYNLRPLILDIQPITDSDDPRMQLHFHLMAKEGGLMGRPDMVLDALAIDPHDCIVTRESILLDLTVKKSKRKKKKKPPVEKTKKVESIEKPPTPADDCP